MSTLPLILVVLFSASAEPDTVTDGGMTDTRYLMASSARMPKRGQALLSLRSLASGSAEYALTDYLSAQLGTSPLVALIDPPRSFNAVVGIRAGVPLSEHLHVGAAVGALALPFSGSGRRGTGAADSERWLEALASGILTFEHSGLQVSLSAGLPWTSARWETSDDIVFPAMPLLGRFATSLSGSWRMTPWFALVSENWILLSLRSPGLDESFVSFNALSARFNWGALGLDAGAFVVAHRGGILAGAPLPWLSLSYEFNLR